MKKMFLSNSFVAVSLLALGFSALRSATPSKYPMEPVFLEPGLQELVTSRLSMVSSAHPFATEAGLEMLRRGGNAMDAAIAATMVTGVMDVGLTQFGGGGQLTYYDAKTKKTLVINCDPKTVKEDVLPYNAARDGATGRAIPIPGSIAGFYYAVTKYGALPWKQVIEPAIFYAENGFPLYGPAYTILQDRYNILAMRPNARQIFAPNDFLPHVGAIFKQPELAETLKKIADQGPDYFYRGPFAEKMVKAIRDIGGLATMDDFASYKVLELEPVRGTYKGYDVVGPPLPSTGAVSIIEGLNILENVDLKRMGHYAESADSLQWVIETLRVIASDTRRYNAVPESDRPLAEALMSKEYARAQYNLIRYKIEQMNRAASNKPVQLAELGPARDVPDEDVGTNHVSTVDKDGSVCSFTHTIYGPVYSAHGLFVGGIILGSGRSFRALPGERIMPGMAAIIVFKGDKPYFATGSSGGTPNTFYTALNVLAWDKNLKQAQEAPRFPNSWGGLNPDDNKIAIEHRIPDKVVSEVIRRGYQIEWLGPYSQGGPTSQGGLRSLGGDQMVGIDPQSGMRYGATDPRGVGKAAGQ
jgi:gamma-glutamyltranspeptidase/glutathione hydrolase